MDVKQTIIEYLSSNCDFAVWSELQIAVLNGNSKYMPNSWSEPIDHPIERDVDKALGHLRKWKEQSEQEDGNVLEEPGSGAHHLAHAITRLMYAMRKDMQQRPEFEVDMMKLCYVYESDGEVGISWHCQLQESNSEAEFKTFWSNIFDDDDGFFFRAAPDQVHDIQEIVNQANN